jgi:hypothetical protein
MVTCHRIRRSCLTCRAKIEGLSRCENCTSFARDNFASTKVSKRLAALRLRRRNELPTSHTSLLHTFKGHRITDHDDPEGEQRYSSTLSLTSALDGGGWSTPRLGGSPPPPGRDSVPIAQSAGWAPGSVWTCAENLAPSGIRSPGRPACSESLYRLHYPEFLNIHAHTQSRRLCFKRNKLKLCDTQPMQL